MNITVIVNDFAAPGYIPEHGLSLWIKTPTETILLDTGQGGALRPNGARAGIDFADVGKLIFSHGHYDHTGGLVSFLEAIPDGAFPDLYYGPGADKVRFRQSPGDPPKEIGMPPACREAFRQYPTNKKRQIDGFTRISDELFLSGPIPRLSGEDTGGNFSLDQDGRQTDWITDEIALLFTDGTLVVGCCHAGIINTVQYCQKNAPDIPIRKIVGGLHLLHASEERMNQTAAFLDSLNLEDLQLLHCTGNFCLKR